jgi:hypothetical protein
MVAGLLEHKLRVKGEGGLNEIEVARKKNENQGYSKILPVFTLTDDSHKVKAIALSANALVPSQVHTQRKTQTRRFISNAFISQEIFH